MRNSLSTTGTTTQESDSLLQTVTGVFGDLREAPVTSSTRLDEFTDWQKDRALDVLGQTMVGPDRELTILKTSKTIGDLVNALREQIAADL